MRDIKQIVSEMTLREKASMVSGCDNWRLDKIERLGIETVMVSDGPHGLRKQADESMLGANDSIKAVCFPTAVGTAASFNRELFEDLGKTLGEECQAENVHILLGPAVNIKRSPLCGRNFEYFSEDPYLAGEVATSYINGVQSKNIGTSIKHFAANNQEKRRNTIDDVVDERALREIYFPAFETAVKESKPWTVMCSYNKINGSHSSENGWLLNKVLRDEWGFDGYVMSDWGATTYNRAKCLENGLDLEMPSSGDMNTDKLLKAIHDGKLKEECLDIACERILDKTFRYLDNRDSTAVFDKGKDHEKARKAACESMVLLKNNGILPLSKKKKIAFIGEFAENPRFQGGGSSHIMTDNAVGAVKAAVGTAAVVYSKGFSNSNDVYDDVLAKQALEIAKTVEVVVVFAGLPEFMESESFDRQHLNLPGNQNRLIRELLEVNKNVVVVLQNGSPVLMPWLNDVSAVLESYLGGEAVGEAQIDLLFGKVNPSAKLAETFPLTLSDTPSFGNFPGYEKTVEYRESIYVGYRYYDKAEKDVLFPFGFGLSYTSFEYSDIKLSKKSLKPGASIEVSFKIKNTGKKAGAEIAQIYVSSPEKKIFKAPKELRQFTKVFLKSGEEKEVTLTLNPRAFMFYNTKLGDWDGENGVYKIMVGASSRDIKLEAEVKMSGYSDDVVLSKKDYPSYYEAKVYTVPDNEFENLVGYKLPERYSRADEKLTIENSFYDARNTRVGGVICKVIRSVIMNMDAASLGNPEMIASSALETPLYADCAMSCGMLTENMGLAIVDLMNGEKRLGAVKTLAAGGIDAAKRAVADKQK